MQNPYAAPDMPMLSPEDLEKFFALGGQLGEDGSLVWPDFGTPNAGAMTAMESPAATYKPGSGKSPLETPAPPSVWDDPIYSAHMAIRNPAAPEGKDPASMVAKQARKFGKEPKPGVNVMVPGGASIQNGMPQAAPFPTAEYTQADDPMKPQGNPYGGRYGRMQTVKKGR